MPAMRSYFTSIAGMAPTTIYINGIEHNAE